MSTWPGKYVIGLTGNIATGKSVVRKMLEHLDAYGIDADALSHRAIAQGAPGYRSVVDTFGKWVLASDGQIDRVKLAHLVFSNPGALDALEIIIHPLVRQAVDILARRASQKVIVLEAIKILEGELRSYCNTIWVVDASEEIRMLRLIQKRNMDSETAWDRIHAQSPQAEKVKVADVIIQNSKSFEETWKQVLEAWQSTVPVAKAPPAPVKRTQDGELTVRRARPQEAQDIAEFITRLSGGQRRMTRMDVMEAFGEKAFLFLSRGDDVVGLLGWQVENLVARVDDVYIDASVPLAKAMKVMTAESEKASRELQCEASLLFLPPALAQYGEIWETLEYSARSVKDLVIRAWQDAAMESMPPGTVLLFKQLRKDRILRPV